MRRKYDDEGKVKPGSTQAARMRRLKLAAQLREDPQAMSVEDRQLARKQKSVKRSRIEERVTENVTRRFNAPYEKFLGANGFSSSDPGMGRAFAAGPIASGAMNNSPAMARKIRENIRKRLDIWNNYSPAGKLRK